jgi:hypothetical protein
MTWLTLEKTILRSLFMWMLLASAKPNSEWSVKTDG